MTRQTNADNIRDAIVNLGGTPRKGRPTTADLLDQFETLVGGGGGSPADVTAAVNRALDQRLPDAVATAVAEALEEGGLSDADMDDVFGG